MARAGGWLITTLRWGFGLCALLLVLAALYVSLGRELVHWVAEYRDEVQARAQTALGLPLRIGSLEGGWRGFAPVIHARDVEIGEGAERVRLDHVRLVPDVISSLLERQPRLAALTLQGLSLGLRQGADGSWRLEGLPHRGGAFDVEQALLQLKRIARISLLDSQFTVEAQGSAPISFTYVNLSLRSGSRQRLDGRLTLPDGQPLAFDLQARLNTRDWRASAVDLYASLPQSDWARWLPSALTHDWKVQQARAGGELWLSAKDGAVQRGVLRLRAPRLTVGYAERAPATVSELVLNAYYQQEQGRPRLLIDSLAMNLGEERWGEAKLLLERQTDDTTGEHWQVRADRLALAPLLPLVQAWAPLPDTAAAYVSGLRPRGLLRNLRLDLHPQAAVADRVQLATNLEAVGIDPYHEIPGVENVSGSLVGSLAGGELRIRSDGFALHLDHQFPKPWQYRTAAGRLTWRYDDQALTLVAPYLQVSGDDGQLAADMLLRLMRDPAAEDYLDLRVGMRDGDARYTEQYLPTRVPSFSPELARWLKTAIRAGRVDEGFFQFQGAIGHDAEPASHAISLFFKTRDAVLAFQPGWPELREARGDVFVEDSGVRVALAEGRVLETRVTAADAEVPHVEPGQVARLQVNGALDSSVGDALHILQTAPIGTGEIFAGWAGEGAVKGRLRLDIPLHKGDKPNVAVDFAVDGARLKLSNPALELTELRGDFTYDTAKGLSAPDIRAQVFGRPVRGKAVADGRGGVPRSRIDASGQVAVQSLADWLAIKRSLPVSGILPYSLSLLLDGNNSALTVDSTLKGLNVDLPAPFGMSAAEERPSRWRMSLQGPERSYALDYGDLARLVMAMPAGRPGDLRGELLLGKGQPSVPSTPGLLIRGQLAELDAGAWMERVKRYAASDQASTAKQLVRRVDLQVGHFKGYGVELDNVQAGLLRGNNSWSLDLDHPQVKGRVVLPDSSVTPIVVNLARLRLPPPDPQANDDQDEPDPLAAVDPRQVPPLDVKIAQLYRGDVLFGAFSLSARPTAQGVAFRNLDLDLKGLKIGGDAWWEGTPGQSRTRYKGRLQGGNLADVLTAWSFAPNVTSERFRLDVDGQWPGSPAWVSLKRLSGTLDASLRNGQFVEVEGGAQALRVFGLLNFNSIGRRLRLDFSDLLGKGLSYDRVKALLVASDGVYVTRKPLTIEGPSSNLELDGTLDLARDQINAKLLVTLPLTNNLPIAALIVGAPAVGGALFVVDKLLGDKVSRFASVQYHVRGPWKSPQITLAKPFEKR